MSVLVLGVLSYPSPLPNLDQNIDPFDFQQLGNVAFADDEEEGEEENGEEENGEEENGEEENGEEENGEEEEEEVEEAEEEEEEEEEIELEGIIASVNSTATSFTLQLENGTTFTILTDANTEFEDLGEFSDLTEGDEVEVEAVLSNGDLLATEVEPEEEEEEEEEYEEEYEIEVEVEYGVAKVEIEFDDHKYRFVQNFTDENSLAESILGEVPDLPLNKSQIMGIWELDIEEEEDEDMSYTTMIENEEEAQQTAQDLIYELQQRIEELEARIQTLLEKFDSGEYFGVIPEVDSEIHSYIISFEGSATSIDDESIVIDSDGEIFIENMVTTGDVSKFRVTGGEISIDNTFYDLVFGKARVSSSGTSGEKDSLVLIGQVINFGNIDDDGTTLKLVIDTEMPLEGDFGLDPITIEILPQSKIAGQWHMSGSGQLSLLEG